MAHKKGATGNTIFDTLGFSETNCVVFQFLPMRLEDVLVFTNY